MILPDFEVRSFNAAGLEAFRQFLSSARDGRFTASPLDLLESSSLTEVRYPGVHVDHRKFKKRREAADYFHSIFCDVPPELLRRDAGLWSWLSLFYFDQVCPLGGGRRTVRNDYTYIYMPEESRYFYRHLLFISWYVRQLAPDFNRLFLDVPLHQLDKFTQDVFKRLYLTRIPCIFEVLDRLYWDRSTGRPRKGVNSPGRVVPGDLAHRLPVRIRQLERTYDLFSLREADQLLHLLGDEFQSLLAAKESPRRGAAKVGA